MFRYSDPEQVLSDGQRGSGHISINNIDTTFSGGVSLGIDSSACVLQNTVCATDEFCVFKTTPTQGHIADCTTANNPMINDFQWHLCCEATEICDDGIDNSGNGLIDCADPACHSSIESGFIPQICTGNFQTTEGCVEIVNGNPVYNPDCQGPDPFNPSSFPSVNVTYYCSYGVTDNPSAGAGKCCPSGTYFDSFTEECEDFQECGITDFRPCGFNFKLNKNSWLSQVYSDLSPDNWCHSVLPNFVPNSGGKSEACCPTIHHGNFGYYIKDENIKVFGVE